MFNLVSGCACLSLAIIVRVVAGPGDAVLVGWAFGFLNIGIAIGGRGRQRPTSPPSSPQPKEELWPPSPSSE